MADKVCIRNKIRTVPYATQPKNYMTGQMDNIFNMERDKLTELAITRNSENRTLRWYGQVKKMVCDRWPNKFQNGHKQVIAKTKTYHKIEDSEIKRFERWILERSRCGI